MNQHLRRSIYAIMQQGGVKLSDERSHHAQAAPGRPQCGQARGDLARVRRHCRWTTDLDAALADPDILRLLRRADHRPPRRCRQARRSPPASTSTARSRSPTTSTAALELYQLAQEGRREARRGAGQALAARHAEAEDAARPGLLRQDSFRARRVRLLGVRGRHRARAAAVVELPQGGRRRHHHRHALPLALRARQSVRRGESGLLPGRDAHSRRAGTKRANPTSAPPTIPPTPPSNWRAASSPISIPPGACACAATIC